jgi:hypothetical protein
VTGDVILENVDLRVVLSPDIGGTVTEIYHKGLRQSVLGRVPWNPVRRPEPDLFATNEDIWLTRYTGGWPLLFPNAGDACHFRGVDHGFHGEASLAQWQVTPLPDGLRLERFFDALPVRMTRNFTLDGDVLNLTETAEAEGTDAIAVMWGQHVTFGSDLLEGPVIVEAGAVKIAVDDAYDPPENPWLAGASGDWPQVPSRNGRSDASRPEGPMATLAYLTGFNRPFVAIRRLDGAVGAVLSWQGDVYDCVWYWCELGGTPGPPWHSRARLIGLEPCSTPCGHGLAEAARRKARLIRLCPGQPVTASLRLHVFQPAGAVTGTDPCGRATMA